MEAMFGVITLEPNSWSKVELRAGDSKCEDPYTLAVMCNSAVVGHVPREMSVVCAWFLGCKLPHVHNMCKGNYVRGYFEFTRALICKIKLDG